MFYGGGIFYERGTLVSLNPPTRNRDQHRVPRLPANLHPLRFIKTRSFPCNPCASIGLNPNILSRRKHVLKTWITVICQQFLRTYMSILIQIDSNTAHAPPSQAVARLSQIASVRTHPTPSTYHHFTEEPVLNWMKLNRILVPGGNCVPCSRHGGAQVQEIYAASKRGVCISHPIRYGNQILGISPNARQ